MPKADQFNIEIPLDASAIADRKPETEVKVLVRDGKGNLQSQTVRFDAKGNAKAAFGFAENPGAVRVIVGPPDATNEQLTGLQTIAIDVNPRRWAGKPALSLNPIAISPYYWFWWPRWCREFTIRGVVQCPDGTPVPGAQVCAYDVDWWWLWSTKDLIQCATTDISGAFQMKFRWCCGWWPWWWWRNRYWQFEPILAERVLPVIQRRPELQRLLKTSPQPSLKAFEETLADETGRLRPATAAVDPALLPNLRERLMKRLPQAPELERMRIWPWWPWLPWWDCAPDVIFRVTQDCHDRNTVIVDESIWQTRWDIPTTLDVKLIANDKACCIPPPHGCLEGNCLSLTEFCQDTVDHVAGNVGAPPALPALLGYENPGLVSNAGDRPYGGVVNVYGTADCMDGVDYYEFEWATSSVGPWNTMPPAANGDFARDYLQFVPLGMFHPVFSATIPTDGRHVYETLPHYEATHPPADWGGNRVWLGSSRDLLMSWLTENIFTDGVYYLHVKGWNIDGAGHLINPRVLKICSSKDDNYGVLRLDNRSISAGPLDAHGYPCGLGTVHTCTTEPEAAIIDVKILHEDGTETHISGCGNTKVTATDYLIIDFVSYDHDGHLSRYTLQADYDVNLSNDLLALGGTLTPSPVVVPWAPAAVQVGPTYAVARSAALPPYGGASAPTWTGGAIRLKVKATGPGGAFPYTCCYQLQLRSHKRTIVNCDYTDWGHTNYTEYSFNVVV